MEFINGNKGTILKWYKKQINNEDKIPVSTTGCFHTTDNVKIKHIEEIEAVFNTKAIKMNIIPLLYNNHCHTNVQLMMKILNKNTVKYTSVLGYNIIACDCGSQYLLELHSVLKNIETNEMIDLTTDYGGETVKWFIPFKENTNKQEIHFILNNLNCGYYSSVYNHKCYGRELCIPRNKYDGELNGFYKQLLFISKVHFYNFD